MAVFINRFLILCFLEIVVLFKLNFASFGLDLFKKKDNSIVNECCELDEWLDLDEKFYYSYCVNKNEVNRCEDAAYLHFHTFSDGYQQAVGFFSPTFFLQNLTELNYKEAESFLNVCFEICDEEGCVIRKKHKLAYNCEDGINISAYGDCASFKLNLCRRKNSSSNLNLEDRCFKFRNGETYLIRFFINNFDKKNLILCCTVFAQEVSEKEFFDQNLIKLVGKFFHPDQFNRLYYKHYYENYFIN